MERKVTVPDLQRMKEAGTKITALTAYDFPFGRIVDDAGIDVILVGDTLGHGRAGARDDAAGHARRDHLPLPHGGAGAARALLVGDLPFLSYQVSVEDALAQRRPPDEGRRGRGGEARGRHRRWPTSSARSRRSTFRSWGTSASPRNRSTAWAAIACRGAGAARAPGERQRVIDGRDRGRGSGRVRRRARGHSARPRRRRSPSSCRSRRSASGPAADCDGQILVLARPARPLRPLHAEVREALRRARRRGLVGAVAALRARGTRGRCSRTTPTRSCCARSRRPPHGRRPTRATRRRRRAAASPPAAGGAARSPESGRRTDAHDRPGGRDAGVEPRGARPRRGADRARPDDGRAPCRPPLARRDRPPAGRQGRRIRVRQSDPVRPRRRLRPLSARPRARRRASRRRRASTSLFAPDGGRDVPAGRADLRHRRAARRARSAARTAPVTSAASRRWC